MTPVRATPSPAGGAGSSRQIVVWPSPTSGTSRTEPVGPDGKLADTDSQVSNTHAAQHAVRKEPLTMTLRIPWSAATSACRHEPDAEIWVGVRTPGTELPERVDGGARARPSRPAPTRWSPSRTTTGCSRVHSDALLGYLAQRLGRGGWLPASRTTPGRTGSCRTCSPTPEMLAGLPVREPVAVHARAGRYCYDTMTLIGPGTWEAARAAVDVALTAADLVAAGAHGGVRAVPAARPSRDPRRRSAGRATSTTQPSRRRLAATAAPGGLPSSTSTLITATAPSRCSTTATTCSTPRCTSTPVPAGSRTSLGFADERGRGARQGYNLNRRSPPAPATHGWLAAVTRDPCGGRRFAPDALVVSLGVDARR